MENNCLDNFGRLLMDKVRDESIERYKSIVDNKIKAPDLIKLAKKIKSLSEDEQSILNELISEVVDNLLFNLLNTLEEEEKIKLFYYDNQAIAHDVVKLSDGLSGELFTEDGWICRYSKYKSDTDC